MRLCTRSSSFNVLSGYQFFFLVLCLCAVCHGNSYGQSPANIIASVAPETLSNTYVTCFFKDSKGFLWIGTGDGLVRYDGTNAHRYEHDPQYRNSLCNSAINTIIEDEYHQLWIGTAQGVAIYNREKDSFTTLDSLPGLQNQLNNRYITALSIDQHGSVWIGTHEGGINVFDREKLSFTYLQEQGDGKKVPSTDYVNTLLNVDDMMWCGTKGGLRVYYTGKIRPAPLNFLDDQSPAGQVVSLVPDNIGNVWMTTGTGDVIKVTPKNGYYTLDRVVKGELSYGPGWGSMLTLSRDQKGNFWVGGENAGLNYLDVKKRTISKWKPQEQDRAQFSSIAIRSIYVDNHGLVWIGTFNKGAYLINEMSGKFLPGKSLKGGENNFAGKLVRSFAEDRKGNIWIATDEVGLGKIDSKNGRLTRAEATINAKLANEYLNAVICDRQGKLWVGGSGNGAYRINPDTYQLEHFSLKSGSFGDNKVISLYEDKSGTIWAGTLGSGLFYFDEPSQAFKVLYEADKHDHLNRTAYVTSILEDSFGTLWIGTAYGLYALKNDGAKTFQYKLFLPLGLPGSISSSGIQAMYEDKRKNLWIGTIDNGINVKAGNDSLFDVYRKTEGLGSNSVRAIVGDASGDVWISSNMGLSKFNPDKKSFTVYTRQDGLRSDNFFTNACLRSSAGQMFFGSNDGFTVFYPDSIHRSSGNPIVYLTDLKINNRSVSVAGAESILEKHIAFTKSIDLSFEQRSFVIDFVALDIARTAKRTYCYKLEGFDKEWNCTDGIPSATYTNMDPGNYIFLVKASDGDGGWGDHVTKLEISIQQAWWKTWWAIGIYIFLAAAIAFIVIRVRLSGARMKHQLMLERLAREREHEMGESKTQFFNNISHEFRTPLSLILLPLESLMTNDELPTTTRDKVVSAYRSANKMMNLVNELMDFSKIESGNLQLNLQFGEIISPVLDVASAFDETARKRNIRYSVVSAVPIVKGWFDHDKLDKILLNVLSNAFKFTRDGGQISVTLNITTASVSPAKIPARCLEINVLDNGLGIGPSELPHIFDKFYQARSASRVANPGTGIGLSWTKALVELHHGTVTAESVPNRETKFKLVIPIDAEVFQAEITALAATASEAESTVPDFKEVAFEAHHGTNDVKANVLVVEDNDDLRSYLVTELQRTFNVTQASDGVEGLRAALEHVPDIIVSDVLMPNKTGLELCSATKADLKTSHIPFVLLTAKATLEDQITGVETGADVYLTKPFSIRLLMTHLHSLIESRKKLHALFSQDVYLLPSRNASDELDKVFLQRLVDHIVAHLQNSQLGVDALADAFNLSRVQVYRKIKALTGQTAVEFIRNVRLKQSIKLMETKQFSLSEIAYQTGFSSASYFTRCFKEAYGKAPSEFLAASA